MSFPDHPFMLYFRAMYFSGRRVFVSQPWQMVLAARMQSGEEAAYLSNTLCRLRSRKIAQRECSDRLLARFVGVRYLLSRPVDNQAGLGSHGTTRSPE